MIEPIQIRKCAALEEFHECVELQRRIWGEKELEVEPATMFVVAAHSGGQVLGAFDGKRMVGYTLALAGLRDSVPYLHSHMTGIDGEYRDRGIGRMLKLFQREEALGRGIRLIQWTFDPLEFRNAHFNLNKLGAICRQYFPNLYGLTTSPLHRGLPTDRLLVEWNLDSKKTVAAIGDLAHEDGFEAPVRIEVAKPDGGAGESAEETAKMQETLRSEFTNWFARGYAAVGFQTLSASRAYLLTPWSDF